MITPRPEATRQELTLDVIKYARERMSVPDGVPASVLFLSLEPNELPKPKKPKKP